MCGFNLLDASKLHPERTGDGGRYRARGAYSLECSGDPHLRDATSDGDSAQH